MSPIIKNVLDAGDQAVYGSEYTHFTDCLWRLGISYESHLMSDEEKIKWQEVFREKRPDLMGTMIYVVDAMNHYYLFLYTGGDYVLGYSRESGEKFWPQEKQKVIKL